MLLVGILVVGIIVYIVYRYMLSPSLTIEDCRQQAVNFCSSCRAAGCLVSVDVPTVCSSMTGTVNTACDKYFAGTPSSCETSYTYCPQVGIT